MNTDTEYNPADAGKPMNATRHFCDNAHEVTRAEREAALDGVDRLIEQTKKEFYTHE